jgi:hypothetical protein
VVNGRVGSCNNSDGFAGTGTSAERLIAREREERGVGEGVRKRGRETERKRERQTERQERECVFA